MKKILYIPLILIIVSCGGKGVEGNVGQIISIAAEEILEETNVDYNWIIMGQPDGSLLSPKDLKYKNNGQEMMFSPDYPGDYTFEVSITKFGDELSNQSFFFTISDIEDEDVENIEDEKSKEEEWLKESLEEYEEESDDEEEYEEESDNEEEYEEESDDEEEYEKESDDEEEVSKKQTATKASTKAIVAKNRKTSKNKSVKGADILAKKDRFTIQVISKKRLGDAQQYANKLIKSGYDAYIQKAYFKETEEVWYRVRIGSYDNYNSAQAIANVVSKDIKLSVWVDFVRIDN